MLRPYSALLIATAASASAVILTICIGGLAVFLIADADDAKAESVTKVEIHQTYAKGDRLPVLEKGAICSSRGWPYYDPGCLYDMRRPFAEMRTVRMIALH